MTKQSFVILVVLSSLVYLGLTQYLDRPTVEVSVDTGHCVRAYGPNGALSCKEVMSRSHETIFVDPKHFKKVLSDRKEI